MNAKGDTESSKKKGEINLKDPSLYINRELSWLEFNRRVLEEAEDNTTPALDRVKFISIFSSNLDEFFMVRVGGLCRLVQADVEDTDSSGRTPMRQLGEILDTSRRYVNEQYRCFNRIVLTELKKAGIEIHDISSLDSKEIQRLNSYFKKQVFPILTPLAVDAGHPFPFLANLKLNLMVVFKEYIENKKPKAYAFVEVPTVLPRLIPVNKKLKGHHFILLEDLITANIGSLFPGMKIKCVVPFRITRNQDYDLHEDEVSDLLKSVEAELKDRSNKIAVRLEIMKGAPDSILDILCEQLDMDRAHVYHIPGPLNLRSFMDLYSLPVDPIHKDPPFNPRIPRRFDTDKDIFTVIREGDILLHHPYDSFAVVVDFLNAAADDPDVLAIKQTLYRVDKDSPVIHALRRAAESGKQVTAVVELKARFDEESNIDFARQMEEVGVNPVYGFVTWKTHCKATLVVRREGRILRRYVHLSTGNYNSETAKLYTDLGLFTADPVFGNDVSALFNVITGFNSWTGSEMFKPETVVSMFEKVSLSPVNTQLKIHQLIEREIAKSKPKNPGRIIAKMNALVDAKTIRMLYKASQAGVRIDLIVRGICCLRPGLPGISEHIKVISILDRFLEHTRIYYFHNGGEPEIFSGSADWMPRNFKRRAEILYPIEDTTIKTRLIDEILMTYLSDNTKARIMQSDGSYVRVERDKDTGTVRSQERLIAIARKGGVKSPPYEELVRRIGKKRRKKKR
ncbi:MAG: polyphosphate kinase 1 [bacterium]|nr:MAG: polyphosphate kinase 1 [bacterium]